MENAKTQVEFGNLRYALVEESIHGVASALYSYYVHACKLDVRTRVIGIGLVPIIHQSDGCSRLQSMKSSQPRLVKSCLLCS